MEYLILITVLIVIALPVIFILRKKSYKNINNETNLFLTKRGASLVQELQNFIDSQNINARVLSASAENSFRYKNKQLVCITVKFKIEGKKECFLGIVSDSGSYTEFDKFNILTNYRVVNTLLQKIYRQPKKTINSSYFTFLPNLENVYNFNISSEEKIIFNSVVKNFKTDYDISIGINAKVVMTDKKIYISNGLGLWTIDIYDDISDYIINEMCIEIYLTELCFFGANNERICTGFKLYFNEEALNKFKTILENIIM